MPELQDTESIINAAIQDLPDDPHTDTPPAEITPDIEEGTGSPQGGDPEPGEAQTPPDGGTPAGDPAKAADDPFAKEHGIEIKPGQKINRLPYDRVQKIVANAKTKEAVRVLEALTGVKFKDGEKFEDVLEAQKKLFGEYPGQISGFEAKMKEIKAIEAIMESDPERFLQMLPHVNPKYAELLAKKVEQAVESGKPAAEPVPMPTNLDLSKPEDVQKLLAWNAGEVTRQVMGNLSKDLEPIRKQRQSDEMIEASRANLRKQIERAAEHWPGFKENAPAILDLIGKDPQAQSIHDAYRIWRDGEHGKKLAELEEQLKTGEKTREQIRAELMTELAKAPKSTGTKPEQPMTGKVEGDAKSTEDIINKAIAGLGD